MRRGQTLHEVLVSLAIMGVVLALATHYAVAQLRFFRGVREVVDRRAQLEQARGIITGVLSGVAPALGELTVAQDSAVEVRVLTGVSVVCAATPGQLLAAAPGSAGASSLGTFVRDPEPGDRVAALFSDSLGATWLQLQVAAAPQPGAACPSLPWVNATWQIAVQEAIPVPTGTVLRFTRPLRLSLYRSSNGRWYLGARDWNGSAGRFNSIQPVAGPLEAYAAGASSGLSLAYRDRSGETLAEPVDPGRVASVDLVLRVPGDSAVAVIRLRNAS